MASILIPRLFLGFAGGTGAVVGDELVDCAEILVDAYEQQVVVPGAGDGEKTFGGRG